MTMEKNDNKISFEYALIQIKKKYKLKKISKMINAYEIINIDDKINKNLIVSIFNANGKPLLTDFSENFKYFQSISIDLIKELCKAYHLQFNNYHIECKYINNLDIENYFAFLKKISEYLKEE